MNVKNPKVIIHRNFEARGDRESPKMNVSLSLKAGPDTQRVPSWAARQAKAAGAAEEYKPIPKEEYKPISESDGE